VELELLEFDLFECLGQSLLLLLHVKLAQVLGVLGSLVVDSALRLRLTLPSASSLVFTFLDGPGSAGQ